MGCSSSKISDPTKMTEKEQFATIRRQTSKIKKETKTLERKNSKTLAKIKVLASQNKHDEAKMLSKELMSDR